MLLISVAQDADLERYWARARETSTPSRLADLDLAGMSIPNFSFFSDAHRFQLLYNRDRLAACLAELSAAGVSIIPHFHSLTRGDSAYWTAWLRAHPHVRYICREFQTGNDIDGIEEMASVQEQIGRDLHPIVVGGRRYAPRLRELFRRSTVIDTTPFLKMEMARRAELRDGRARDDRLAGRIRNHRSSRPCASDELASSVDNSGSASPHSQARQLTCS